MGVWCSMNIAAYLTAGNGVIWLCYLLSFQGEKQEQKPTKQPTTSTKNPPHFGHVPGMTISLEHSLATRAEGFIFLTSRFLYYNVFCTLYNNCYANFV